MVTFTVSKIGGAMYDLEESTTCCSVRGIKKQNKKHNNEKKKIKKISHVDAQVPFPIESLKVVTVQ